uniref:Retrotransposon Copia-like N-terminal domain-containing protein n=1 Tax=Ananas comosus var. bracteatus TaxID=296719 RepID=A0A6V7PY47_ANACO|nr:unnamed protein product [Ananas comosus var. bracteatus]
MASLANPKFPFPSTINVANFVTLKLNDNNYLLWETQVVSPIESQDLLGFLMGETIAPPKMSTSESGATVNNPDYTSWVRTDRLVKSWIVGTLSEEVLGHAVGLQTAAEVWTALTNYFKQSSIAREFDLLAQLQHIRKGNNPLPTYLRNFKSICDQLHAIGKPVSDSTKVFSYQSDDIPRGLAALHITDVHDDEWHPDTGANAHITDKPGNLTNLVPYSGSDSVMVGDGTSLPITHIAATSIGDLLHWGSTLGSTDSTQSSRTSLFDSTDSREVARLFSDEVTTTTTNLQPTDLPSSSSMPPVDAAPPATEVATPSMHPMVTSSKI